MRVHDVMQDIKMKLCFPGLCNKSPVLPQGNDVFSASIRAVHAIQERVPPPTISETNDSLETDATNEIADENVLNK